jgi:membrane protein implicated in regulation of membrane protease activity
MTHTSLAVDFSGVDSDVVAPNGPSADDGSKKPGLRQKKISWRDGFEDLSDDDGEERGANDGADRTTSTPRSAMNIAKASASELGEDDQDKNDENGSSITPRKLSLSERASAIIRRLSLSRNEHKSNPKNLKTSITFGRVDDDADFIEEAAVDPPGPRSYVLIANRPALDQLRSSQFLTLAAFFAFHHSRNTWTLTTTRDFLAYLGDDDTGNKYLAIFTLLTPASVLGLPFVDKIVHKGGYSAGLHVVNALAIGQGIIQVSSDNLNVQVIGFVLYSFYRCFLFSVCFSCLPAFLDGIVLGKGYGLLIFCGGVLSLMNIPLSNAAVQKLGGNFFVPNLIYTIFCAPCILLVWLIHRGFKREAEEKVRLKKAKSDEIQREFGNVINDSDGSEEEVVDEEKTTD